MRTSRPSSTTWDRPPPGEGTPCRSWRPSTGTGWRSSPGASSGSSTRASERRSRSSSTTTRKCRTTPRYRRSSARRSARFPEDGRVIVISRSEPPPAFARHRARRTIDILDWSDLRFTPTEVSGLIRMLARGRWSRQAIRSLHESVDGWAAGLVLRLEQARAEGRASGPNPTSTEVLFDYFAGEVFKHADPDVQEVLLQTAFLPRVTASMARALTGRPAAGEILTALHKQNYFTNKQADDGSPPMSTIPSSASSSCRTRCGSTAPRPWPTSAARRPASSTSPAASKRPRSCCAMPWTGRGSPSWSIATRRACWRKAGARPWRSGSTTSRPSSSPSSPGSSSGAAAAGWGGDTPSVGATSRRRSWRSERRATRSACSWPGRP